MDKLLTGAIRASAYLVLRHRVLMNFCAESEGMMAGTVIDRFLPEVDEPVGGLM